MTASKIFDKAITLMFGDEEDKAEFQPYWFDTLNRILNETFFKNNAQRKMKGKEPFLDAPIITALTDEVDYETSIIESVVVYGCAGYLFMDDDQQLATTYLNKYENERYTPQMACYEVGDGETTI